MLLLYYFLLPRLSQCFIPNPLPVWPLKAWWLDYVPGRSRGDPSLQEGKLLEQAGCPPLLSAASSLTLPAGLTGHVRLSRIVFLKPCPVLLCLMLMSIAL